MRSGPLGVHRPGASPLHRLAPGLKLLGLMGFAILAVLADTVPATVALIGAAAGALLLSASGGPGRRSGERAVTGGSPHGLGAALRELGRVLRGFGLVALLLFAFQTWQHDLARGVVVAGGLLAVVLAAQVVTATTPVEAMVDSRALRPLRPLGVRPERVALAFSLVLRALPVTLQLAGETRDAARARGLGRSPRAYLTPFVLRTVAHARATGAALHARGLGDEDQDDGGP